MKGSLSTGLLLLFAACASWSQKPPAPPPAPMPPAMNLPTRREPPDMNELQRRVEQSERKLTEPAVKRVTIAEFEKTLAANRDANDVKRATVLSGLALTERVTAARLARWNAAFATPRTREILMSLADASAFRPLPADDVPAAAAPSLADQKQMMVKVGNYLSKVLPAFPNLLAIRHTTYFEDEPPLTSPPADTADADPALRSWPLHLSASSKVQVANVNGLETREKENVALNAASHASRLTTAGEFGPILYGVMMDAARSNLAWAAWEPGSEGPLAVFRFDATKEKSHYSLNPQGSAKAENQFVAYRGAVAIRPSDGAIVRLAVEARPVSGDALATASIVVEYAMVDIGGAAYMCPIHGIALSKVAVPQPNHKEQSEAAPLQTQLNDVAFEQYHVFRSNARLLQEAAAEPLPPVAPQATAPPQPIEDTPAPAPVEAQPAQQSALPQPAPSPDPPASAPVAAAPPPSQPAEIPQPPPPVEVSIRTNVDLVLVPVVVRDASGHAVANLQKDDFQVFDNGKPQQISSFVVEKEIISPANHEAPQLASAGAGERDATASSAPRFIVYLFDDIHLKFADLAPVREAARRNLETLGPRDQAALISTSGKVALSFTNDREKLNDALLKVQAAPRGGSMAEGCPNITYYMAREILRDRESGDALKYAAQETFDCKSLDPSRPEMVRFANSMAIQAARRVQMIGNQESRLAITQLRQVVTWLATVPGKKSIILVSPGFLLESDALHDISEIIEKAIRADVFISAIDTRGLDGIDPSRDIQQKGSRDLAFASMKSQMAVMEATELPAVMSDLAEGTGGSFIHNTNDFYGGLQSLLAPPEFTYVLGFKPNALKPDGHFHQLTIKVPKRADLILQSRRGYYAQHQ